MAEPSALTRDNDESPRIMLVAGEASGDLHGARLVAAMRELAPGLSLCGIGGPALAAEGQEQLYDASRLAVVGIVEVLGHLSHIREAMRRLASRMRDQRPDLLILIDFPDFNLIMAKKAKKMGIPVFYYISPQVWAWRAGRVRTIRRLVDRMAVILPFEQEFYRQRGMAVEFVGHPLLDTVAAAQGRDEFLAGLGVDPASPVIGILPGSRQREVASMLPVFLEAARRIRSRLAKAVFLLPLAPTLSEEDLLTNGLAGCGLDVRVVAAEGRYDLMAACDTVMAASGTVSLELAILGTPMVIAYRVSPLTWFLGRRLVSVRFASLVNLVAGREVVPELLQHDATPEKIAEAICALATATPGRQAMLAGLAEVCQRLGGPGASRRAARLALELIPSASDRVASCRRAELSPSPLGRGLG